MPPRNWKLRVKDILEAAATIEGYIEGTTAPEFLKNKQVRDAVIHNLTVIGEAVGHIPDEIQLKFPAVPWPQMKGIRNVLVHEYFKIVPGILWTTVTRDLPPLIDPLKKMLE